MSPVTCCTGSTEVRLGLCMQNSLYRLLAQQILAICAAPPCLGDLGFGCVTCLAAGLIKITSSPCSRPQLGGSHAQEKGPILTTLPLIKEAGCSRACLKDSSDLSPPLSCRPHGQGKGPVSKTRVTAAVRRTKVVPICLAAGLAFGRVIILTLPLI